MAALVMAGDKLKDIGFTNEIIPKFTSIKEAVFPFVRFPGIDIILSPEMKSTGEVMGIDHSPGLAYFKSQLAAGNVLPKKGNVFVSLRDIDKEPAIPLMKELKELGFELFATRGTATALYNAGIKVKAIFRISDGRPSVIDMMNDHDIQWIINSPSTGAAPKVDEIRIRAQATARGITITTTLSGVKAAIEGLQALDTMGRLEVCSLQEYHRNSFQLKMDI
jgi:carbamoyl-phosphate synthase large subunit